MKRRIFLKGVAGASLAAPFLSSLEGTASAQEGASPRRLVIFYTNNGCLTNRWFPKVENGPIDAAALAGTTLAGLSSFAPKLLFPRGLAMFPKGTINGYFDPHDQGMGSKLTAAPIQPDGSHWSTGTSLDHVAAGLVNPGVKSPMVLSVGNAFANVKGIVSYSAPATPYSPETKVNNVYKSLTGVFVSGGGVNNPVLMRSLDRRLSPARVRTLATLGVPPEAKEALAFAFLAHLTMLGQPGNVPVATGARHPVVLGSITPGAMR